jgi:MarR family transcriptional regulator, organic hydroperoxide resistance regulator
MGRTCERMDARPTPNADFKTTIPFTMHRVTALAVASATVEFAPLGLNIQSARVLVVVLQNPEIRIGEIGEITCIEYSTLSHMISRLERDGILKRKRVPDDARAVAVALTAAGRRVATRVHRIVAEHQNSMLAGIPGRDIAVLRRVLDHMAANTEAMSARASAAASKRA